MWDWFERHPNAGLLIAWLGSTAALGVAVTFLPERLTDLWYVVLALWIGRFLLVASVTSWVLERKRRSTAWAWLFLVGLGLVAIAIALLTKADNKQETAQV